MRDIILDKLNVLLKKIIEALNSRKIENIRKGTMLTPFTSALKDYLNDSYSAEEKLWLNKIKMKNMELKNSQTRISIVDYGAGSSVNKVKTKESGSSNNIVKTVSEIYNNNFEPYNWRLLLFNLVREFKPSLCLELGTSLGVSAAFQAAALKINNNNGKIITLEGAEELASFAKNYFEELQLDNVDVIPGRFQDTLKGVLTSNQAVDFVYIDGHHEEEATVSYFSEILPFLSEKSVVVFDDISWSNGMKRAWRKIKANERVKISIDLKRIGICMINSDDNKKEHFDIFAL